MSQNKNYANYYDYDQNRTKTKVNQMPGGNSQLSLAWDAEPVQRRNIRSFSPQVPAQQPQQQARFSSPYQQQEYGQYAQTQGYPQPQQQTGGYQQQQQTNYTTQSQSYGSTQGQRRNEFNMGGDGGERTSVKVTAIQIIYTQVAQQPGGNSNMIFGDYNHFRQDEGPVGSSSKPPRAGRQQPVQQQQAPQQQPYSPFQNSYNNVINSFPQYQQQQTGGQEPFKGQVRVAQPPGGRSNFTLG